MSNGGLPGHIREAMMEWNPRAYAMFEMFSQFVPAESDCELSDVCQYIDELESWVSWIDGWVTAQLGDTDKETKPPPPTWPPE